MRIIAVDDEKIALEALTTAIGKADESAEVLSFRKAEEALNYVSDNPVDVAFLDIEMRQLSGVELAKRLKLINPQINIVFSTGYAEYRGEAFEMHASGYITKPITAEKVMTELQNLRFPVTESVSGPVVSVEGGAHKIYCQTFGNFEVFVDGRPLEFKYERTRELLAYLVDRGSLCSSNEVMTALWEDDQHGSYLRNLKKDLLETLETAGCRDVVANQWGKLGIIPEMIECDLYDWKKGVPAAINAYRGEYMAQYSWAEFSVGMFE